ncbi:hypothetical protein LCGC14_2708890, partial [marine sediment metagenome]
MVASGSCLTEVAPQLNKRMKMKWKVLVLVAVIIALIGGPAADAKERDEVVEPISLIAGAVIGYALKDGKGAPQPVQWHDVLRYLETTKPVILQTITLDASTARTNAEYLVAGDFIMVESYNSTTPFHLRLNEKEIPALNLSRHRSITAPFYRFFITNVAGNGRITLKVSRGIRLESEAINIAELAARLGGIVSFYRRGDVLWLDDFEGTIGKWAVSGTGASASLSTDDARNGAKSGKLTLGAGKEIFINRVMGYPVISNMGFEMSWKHDTSLSQYEWSLYLY